MSDIGLENRDGVEAKAVILWQLAAAWSSSANMTRRGSRPSAASALTASHLSTLASRYGDDLAILWIDSHPDVGTQESDYAGYHAMAVAVLTGHGDPDVLELLPAVVSPVRVALVGVHAWTDEDFPNVAEWGIQSFGPDDLRETTRPLLKWVAATGCSRVAIHFDVDTIDSNEILLGLGPEPNGLTSAEVRHIIADIDGAVDVVGLTIAEFIPRQVMHPRQLSSGFPLIGGAGSLTPDATAAGS